MKTRNANIDRGLTGRFGTCTRRTMLGTTVATLGGLLMPGRAQADEARDYLNGAVAFSFTALGTPRVYGTMDAAIEAGGEGSVVYLCVDWLLADALTVASGQGLTLDLNGHAINAQASGPAIHVCENASLTLQSASASGTRSFDYDGIDAETGEGVAASVMSGGLVTGGDGDVGGALLDAGATLTLDNVAMAGNRGAKAGGVIAAKNCNVYLQNGASIRHNSGDAGGIRVTGEDVNIYLDGASLAENRASGRGGAVRSDADGTRIYLENGSSISGNYAAEGGGATFFRDSWFCVCSSDRTGSVRGNKTAGCGGAIDTYSVVMSSNNGELYGVDFSENHADKDCGAIELRQSNVSIMSCGFTDNTAGGDVGAIRLGLECDATMEDCSVENNRCSAQGTGGGIVCNERVELTLGGTCLVENNTRGENGAADNLRLGERRVLFSNEVALVKGEVGAGSRIGITAASESGTMRDMGKVGEDIGGAGGVFFSDVDGYGVAVEDGELWWRKG